MANPVVQSFFHEPTFTAVHLVHDPASRRAAIIDPVLDFDPKAGRSGTRSIDAVLSAAATAGLAVDWVLETHVHADHLTAAQRVRAKTGARIAIGRRVTEVQRTFAPLFNARDVVADGSQFDRLLAEGDALRLGEIAVRVMETPGHTPACVTYVIGDAAFVGDTLFMPDYGTARADFPGGDAAILYRSIRRILALAPDTRLYLCHDYKAPGRDRFAWQTTVAAERAGNCHVRDGIDEPAFVAMRRGRDAKLDMPALILPSLQVNMRAGRFPPPADNGTTYLLLPVDRL